MSTADLTPTEQLLIYIHRNFKKKYQAAESFGVTRGMLSHVLQGRRGLTDKMREALRPQ